MRAPESFKISETTYPVTHHHIPEDLKLRVTVQGNVVEILYHNGNYQSGKSPQFRIAGFLDFLQYLTFTKISVL